MEKVMKTVEPVELEIPVKDVIARYAITEAIELVRCRTCIFLHCNGFWVVSRPTLANNGQGGALFEMLTMICDFLEAPERVKDDEQREDLEVLVTMVTNILTLPLDAFTDIEYLIDLSNSLLAIRAAYYDRLAKEASVEHEETVEDIVENERFAQEEAIRSELQKELAQMHDRKTNGGKKSHS